MLEKYRNLGIKKLYMIFGMVDETFSINYSANPPADVDKGWFMFFVTLFDHFYWIIGSTAGALFGTMISFNTEGIDFVMTSMFTVIFIEQWKKDKSHLGALFGLGLSALCLIVFGKDNFIIPSMLCILIALTVTKPYLEKIGVACPDCGGELVRKKTRKGRVYYGCENNPECEFMSWQKPIAKKCPQCGGYMIERGSYVLCHDAACGYREKKKKGEE
jgi:hypothetical protein